MILCVFFAIFLGILLGILTGLTPGLHINLVALLLVSFNFNINPIFLAIIIFALSITHTFLDSIPSIYLGAPDPSQALNVLPGHKLLLKGKAHYAVYLTLIGSFLALAFSMSLFPLFFLFLKFFYGVIRENLKYILFIVLAYIIFKQKDSLKALIFFLLSGSLGLLVLNMPQLNNPLFHLLSGLFGISTLFFSLNQGKIPNQKFDFKINLNDLRAIPVALVMGFIAAFLPGLGSAQSAMIGSALIKKIRDKDYLVLVGGINTANMLMSLVSIYVINKARNGSIIAISQVLRFDFNIVILLLIISLIV